jgi:hypothetical protein
MTSCADIAALGSQIVDGKTSCGPRSGHCTNDDFRHTRFVLNASRWLPVGSTVAMSLAASPALAEGERSPMIGGGVVATRAADEVELIGVGLEGTWWWQRVGIAVEGSRRWDVANGDPIATTFGAGLRLLVVDGVHE